jgi:para-nitrobenzyl esterase
MKRRQGLIFITFFVVLFFVYKDKNHDAIKVNKVRTEAGFISGKAGDDGTLKIFMGIPFAAPPIGELRWKAPQPPLKWKGVKECVTPPPSAMQNKPAPYMMWTMEYQIPAVPISEDCLYLNIWTPAKKQGEKLPVIVWIHGGAFTGGSGTVPLYNGEAMAKKGVVFVTINYRLGPFGFLALPELSAESPEKVSGNYGILDQIEALKWVKRNIGSFGGDPGNVTIAGQSAGSISVNALMVSPKAKGLFQRAIGESGGMFSTGLGIVSDLKSTEETGLKYIEQIGVKSLKELREKSADEINQIHGRFGIVVDNVVVLNAEKAFEEKLQNDVPLISGWTADEFLFGEAPSAKEFKATAGKNYGNEAETFLKLFPAGTDEEAKSSHKLMSVLNFGWQNFHWAYMESKTGKNKAWLYYFTRVPPGEPVYGAFHSAELGYALHTLSFYNKPFVKTDYDLENIMSSYWVNFARSGDPNGEGLPAWPVFDDSSPKVIELGDKVEAKPVPYLDQIRFLDKINK